MDNHCPAAATTITTTASTTTTIIIVVVVVVVVVIDIAMNVRHCVEMYITIYRYPADRSHQEG